MYFENHNRLVAKPHTIYTEFGVYDLLNRPGLVIQHRDPVSKSSGSRYRIMDSNGEVLAWIIHLPSLFGRGDAIKAQIVNKHGDVVLVITQPLSWRSSQLKVFLPGYCSVRGDILRQIGTVDLVGHVANRNYQLSSRDFQNERIVKFGDIYAYPRAVDFPLYQNQNQTVMGSVDIKWTGLDKSKFGRFPIYNVRFHNEDEKFPAKDLDFNQRAVLLASAISIDFNYLSRIEVVKKKTKMGDI